jgi:uncharacterized protein
MPAAWSTRSGTTSRSCSSTRPDLWEITEPGTGVTFLPGSRPTGTLHILLRIHPGSGRGSSPERLADGSYRIAIQSPPVDGKANEELIRLLSGEFGSPRSSITILTGVSSRKKLIRVDGVTRIPAWFREERVNGSPV